MPHGRRMISTKLLLMREAMTWVTKRKVETALERLEMCPDESCDIV